MIISNLYSNFIFCNLRLSIDSLINYSIKIRTETFKLLHNLNHYVNKKPHPLGCGYLLSYFFSYICSHRASFVLSKKCKLINIKKVDNNSDSIKPAIKKQKKRNMIVTYSKSLWPSFLGGLNKCFI